MTVRKQILAALVATLALPLVAAAATPDSTYDYRPLSAQRSIATTENAAAADDAGATVSYPLLSYSAGASKGQVETQAAQASSSDEAGMATSYALSSYGSQHDRG